MRLFGHRPRSRGGLPCSEVGKLLQTYLDGELDELRARAVAGHLEDCVRCGMAAETYEQIKAALRRTSSSVSEEPLRRLRAFADDLAAGDVEAGGSEDVLP